MALVRIATARSVVHMRICCEARTRQHSLQAFCEARPRPHTLQAAQMLISFSDEKYGGLASSYVLFSNRVLRIEVSHLQLGCSGRVP